MNDAGKVGEKSHPKITTLKVRKFMEEGHFKSALGPLVAGGGEKNSGGD